MIIYEVIGNIKLPDSLSIKLSIHDCGRPYLQIVEETVCNRTGGSLIKMVGKSGIFLLT